MSLNIIRITKGWLVALAALATHAAFAANAIERVEFSQLPDQTLVKVTLKSGLAAVPSSFSVAAPPRVAFDFPETENATGNNALAANVGTLNSINIVQAGERTRLVLNLASPNHYETKLDGNVLYIALSNGPVAAAPTTPAAERSAASQPVAEQNHVALNNLDFQANSTELATIRIDLSDPSAVLDAHKQGNNGLLLTFADTDLPARLEKRLDVRDFGSPVDSVTTKRYGKGVQVSFANHGDWTYSVRQIDATVIVEVRKIVDDPSNLAGAKELQGKVISFNFTQPVPVSQMIGIFQDITGLNFVVIPGISGEIQSLKMENTPVNVAIDVISRMYGLGFRRYGDIVMVGTAASLAAYDQEERKRAADLVKSEPIQQETFNIRYRTASEIGQCLVTPQQCSGGAAATQTGQPASGQAGYTPTTSGSGSAQAAGSAQQRQSSSIISADGSISWDDATSVIIVEETKSRLDKIRERIAALDRPIKQVMIEARIVQVDANFTRELG
ncbi:MAG TPA: AMIN domain-containing protein, partial [Rhodocyclaceae bacterium]